MKITKRQLNKIVKEEIKSTIKEVLTEDDLESMGERPFEGHGVVDVGRSLKGSIVALERKMDKISKDPTLPDDIKDDKIRAIMDKIREVEQMGV